MGLTVAAAGGGELSVEGDVDREELAVYLRVWSVLNPEAGAGMVEEEG